MTKGETSSTFKSPAEMDSAETRLFNRWLINNAVIGSVVAAGLVAIVVMGPTRPNHPTAGNASSSNTDISAVEKAE